MLHCHYIAADIEFLLLVATERGREKEEAEVHAHYENRLNLFQSWDNETKDVGLYQKD
jgi:hypothetical protein